MKITKAFHLGWEWGFGPDGPSRNFAVLASYHPVWSITWKWVVYWSRGFRLRFQFHRHNNGGWFIAPLLWLGSVRYDWQHTVRRQA